MNNARTVQKCGRICEINGENNKSKCFKSGECRYVRWWCVQNEAHWFQVRRRQDEVETAVFFCEIVFVRQKTKISQCGV